MSILGRMQSPARRLASTVGGRDWIRFDRNELSGAFGDMGTDFPLIVGMTLAAGLDPAGVLTLFGVAQVLTGLLYGLPMPVQPLKAVATLVITQKLSSNVLYGGGLAIGVVMLLLVLTGMIDTLARAIPKVVVRGIQFGLGLQLAMLALTEYVPAAGAGGYLLAAVTFWLTVLLLGSRRLPPAPLVILAGLFWAFMSGERPASLMEGVGIQLPHLSVPTWDDVQIGFLVLALPQIPLSLGNSILATHQVAADLFPQRGVTVRKIGLTYALMNLVNPFLQGIPICHGSGGIAGHYTFGGRTGGSVVLYGSLYLVLGLFLSGSFRHVVRYFPLPVLGIILLFEAIALLRLVRDTAAATADFSIVLLVGVLAVSLPYGYLVGLIVGTVLAYLNRRQLTGFGRAQ